MNHNKLIPAVDWNAYAQKYDMLLAYNPYYQEAFQNIIATLKEWNIEKGGIVADLGAGTGNYSVEMARLFPDARIMHIDNNKTMNAQAAKKAVGLSNFEIMHCDIQQVELATQSLQGLLCINSLYTFPAPQAALQKMNKWLAPGARAVFLDPGRIMNITAWKLAISKYLLGTYGLKKTLHIFKESQVVGKQNAYIRAMQKNGSYWTHSHEGFCEAIREAGFQIEAASTCFRGECDLVLARKA